MCDELEIPKKRAANEISGAHMVRVCVKCMPIGPIYWPCWPFNCSDYNVVRLFFDNCALYAADSSWPSLGHIVCRRFRYLMCLYAVLREFTGDVPGM